MRRTLLCGALAFGLALPVGAVGTLTVTDVDVGAGITKHTIAWVADASGDVSGETLAISRGRIVQVRISPASGGTKPDHAYDVELHTAQDVDLLQDAGCNVDEVESKLLLFVSPYYHDALASLDLIVENAGNANGGTVEVWVDR